jgi:hypothetical protein
VLLAEATCLSTKASPLEAVATFSRSWNSPFCRAFTQIGGGGEMNECKLATAGLVVAFAAVLLVASHLFIESHSAKQFVKGSIDLKITTNTVASWL